MIVFTTADGFQVVTKPEEVAKFFGNKNKNKISCFLEFDKENQVAWAVKHIDKPKIELMDENCTRVVYPPVDTNIIIGRLNEEHS